MCQGGDFYSLFAALAQSHREKKLRLQENHSQVLRIKQGYYPFHLLKNLSLGLFG